MHWTNLIEDDYEIEERMMLTEQSGMVIRS